MIQTDLPEWPEIADVFTPQEIAEAKARVAGKLPEHKMSSAHGYVMVSVEREVVEGVKPGE